MEEVLSIYEKPIETKEPVVCLDEKPFELKQDFLKTLPLQEGKGERYDYAYDRFGMVNIFCAVSPKSGKHFIKVTKNRKGPEFARFLKDIYIHYSKAKKIHLVLDNLSTHTPKQLKKEFGEKLGRLMEKRFVFHYTPKHASWLNQAEIEIGLVTRECLKKRRIPTMEELVAQLDAWQKEANKSQRTINWKFTRTKARKKFHYSKSFMKRS